MTKILKKEQLSDRVWRYRLEAPIIAKKHKPGQFIILRVTKDGERIPLTIANSDAENGWIEIIFQAVGLSTQALSALDISDTIVDLVGPLGNPTHIEKFGKCLCVGGGVGVAPLYPIILGLKECNNDITAILGARNENFIVLENEITKYSDRVFIATDDGSRGYHGFIPDLVGQLLDRGEHFDFAIIIGPPMMMKRTSEITLNAGIKTYVSLNPVMIDGTGMCGGCRVMISGKTRFACIEGPEFDATGVDWDSFMKRLRHYPSINYSHKESHSCQLEKEL